MAADPRDADNLPAVTAEWPEIDPSDAGAVLREFLLCRADPVYFISRYVKIRVPGLGTVPFRLWPWQARLIDLFRRERRVIILKSRQLGVSELVQVYGLWTIRFHDSKTILYLSKTEDDAIKLLQRTQLAYAHLPAWLQGRNDAAAALGYPQPPDLTYLGRNSTSLFTFEHLDADRRSSPSWITSLPATENTGRSIAADLVVMDEWAFQGQGQSGGFSRQLWAAVEPTIDVGGQLIGVSTANGTENAFYDVWEHAVRRDNGFKHVFLPWHLHPQRDAAWYAAKERALEPWQLHQEYPRDASEAFIQTARSVFDHRYLAAIEERLRTGASSGDLAAPLEDADGLTIWEAPVGEQPVVDATTGEVVRNAAGTPQMAPAHTYVLAADVSEGLVDGDYDAACVIDRQTWRQVAELRGKWPPEVYAQKLWALAARYHIALLAVERNNHGHTVLLALASGLAAPPDVKAQAGTVGGWGLPQGYSAVYHHADPSVPGARPTLRAGWPTNSMTKPLMIDALAKALREGTYQPRSLPFVYEAKVYAYDEHGRMGAPQGKHDDLVIAHAIAVYLAGQPDPSQAALGYLARMQQLVDGRVAEAATREQTARLQPGAPGQGITRRL